MKLIYIFIIVIILYTICYYIFPSEISILQTNIELFNFSLLSKRQPIVISNYIHDPIKVIESWFKYNFIKKLDKNDNNDWKHNNYKYLFINATDNIEVIIYKAQIQKQNPKTDDKIIIIKLEKNQSLILPFKWKYYIDNDNYELWGIDDIITSSFGKFF
jgi:hypothetical protein